MTGRAPWLADVLTEAGCRVVPYRGWQGRGRTFTDLRAVVWHHDASQPGDSPNVPKYMLGEMAHGRAGAQVWVDRRGAWHLLADGMAFHAGRVRKGMPGNGFSLGVETDHTTGEDWPPALLDSLRAGTAAILTRLGRDEGSLHFHKTICDPPGRKSDPDGLDLTTERARMRRALAAPDVKPAPPIEEDDMAWSDEDKAWMVNLIDARLRILLRAEGQDGKPSGHPNLRDITAKLHALGQDVDALDVPRKQ